MFPFRCTEPDMIKKSVISLLASFLLAGCVAGPNYAGPPEVFSANRNDGFVRAGGNVSDAEPELADWVLPLNVPAFNRLTESPFAVHRNSGSVGKGVAVISEAGDFS